MLPTTQSERIISIDMLRGVAVLGILIMNIQSFSMIGAAYLNPAAYGDLNGINKWVWILSHMTANEKFLSIFSMLFGAGTLLFISRATEKGKNAGALHFRRMLWLFLFGMLHAYLIWYGDILVTYSLCGMFVYLFRKQEPKTLVIISLVFFMIPVLLSILSGMTLPLWPKESYNQNLQSWMPDSNKIAEELAAMRGSWTDQMKIRVGSSIFMQTFLFLYLTFWRVTSMMLLGMALLRWGILQVQRSTGFYTKMVIFGLIPGYFLSGWGIHENFRYNWLMDFSMFFGSQFNYIGSIGVALGYIGIVMLIYKNRRFSLVKKAFTDIGKMAFTNYILMSLICMIIFYGNGLGLFGNVGRLQQVYFVIGIWLLLFIFSWLWLRQYRFGPLEWIWRSLTYVKLQSFRLTDDQLDQEENRQ